MTVRTALLFTTIITLSACEFDLRRIVTTKEALEFKSDSTFEVNYLASKLPIVIIETNGQEIPDEPRITAQMGIVYNGEERFNRNWDVPNEYDGLISIERRGFTSQNFPKLQYAVETVDAENLPESNELIGLPKENDWILHAPYSDKSLVRNVLMYKWWADLGHYATRTKFCELILNGSYNGLYVLIEQIKWDKDRVDITKIDSDDNAGDSLTGGYIIKIDKPIGGDGEIDWVTKVDSFQGVKANVSFQYDYPKDDDITPQQQQYIQQFIHQVEATLLSENFADKELGYRKFIDVESFIDFFIMQELSHNVDGYRSSTYFFKRRDSEGGRLVAGPIWDFNLSLGNTTGCEGDKVEGWALDHPCDPTVIPFWWKRMHQDDRYKKKLVERWAELRSGPLRNEKLLADIDAKVSEMGQAVGRNYTRWQVLGTEVWPNNFVGNTHAEEVEFLKDWLIGRVNWIDENIDKL
jgi:hypothetical protein